MHKRVTFQYIKQKISINIEQYIKSLLVEFQIKNQHRKESCQDCIIYA
jgi:hypothetical protein